MSEARGGGRVVLVGAGPGAPDLVTLRGERALRRADAVVYDALSPPELLELAPAHALRIDVGKRGHDAPLRSQEEINALLVELAREGRTVVRLKGGDPFVFGRGGEEASACLAAGVPVEVVPGVSSALAAAAAAGIPVTDRRHAASFAVVTGHKDPSRAREQIDWACLARAVDTLVILMGMRNLEELLDRLLAGGRAPETPAAVVMNATLPEQRIVEAPLSELAKRVREAGLGAPAAVVVGDVVGLRRELAALVPPPALAGLRVLVTRPVDPGDAWTRALAEAGACPVVRPLLRIEPAAGPDVAAALAGLRACDALLLTSANAVRTLAARAAEARIDLAAAAPPAFCVGPVSAEAARAAGLRVHGLPSRSDAEGLLARLRAEGPLAGRRFLWPRAEAARDVLAQGLRAEGARVDAVSFYRSVAADFDAAALRRDLAQGRLDALTFASPSAVRVFVGVLDDEARVACARTLVAAIGPVTARALREAGLAPDAVAERPEPAALVGALARARRTRETQGGTS